MYQHRTVSIWLYILNLLIWRFRWCFILWKAWNNWRRRWIRFDCYCFVHWKWYAVHFSCWWLMCGMCKILCVFFFNQRYHGIFIHSPLACWYAGSISFWKSRGIDQSSSTLWKQQGLSSRNQKNQRSRWMGVCFSVLDFAVFLFFLTV